ncbi:MAG: NUDIX domain-containing protein [Nitrososphaerota archaeon]|nr:NUDIX domain-containing protein [Nitrososphaerota archaeon]
MPRGSKIVLGAGTVIHRRGKMLLVKRAEPPHLGLWSFPGGKVEEGESPLEAAVRETREEVGLKVRVEGVFDVVTYLPSQLGEGNWSQVVLVDYLARPSGGKVVLNGESSDFRWVSPREVDGLDTTPQMRGCARRFEELGIY